MDPSRISLEEDRRGLSGLAFRFGNRVTYQGLREGRYRWRVEILVAPGDELQVVEVDEQGNKTSRRLEPGELFDALELLSQPGSETHALIAALLLTGVELRAGDAVALNELAALLRTSAADETFPMPLRLPGEERPLQLSEQGRGVLRRLADTLEHEGRAMATLPAVKRLEVTDSLVESLGKRVRRPNLLAYRSGDRWFVVLENLPASSSESPPSSEAAAPPPRARGGQPDRAVPEEPHGAAAPAAESPEPAEPNAEPGGPPRRRLFEALAAAEEPGAAALGGAAVDAATVVANLRTEVAFLRQQMRDKDRQIAAWITEGRRKDLRLARLEARQGESAAGAEPVQETAERLGERLERVEARVDRLESNQSRAGEGEATGGTREAGTAPWYRRLIGSGG